MQSTIYPNILFLTNSNLSFLGSQLTAIEGLQVLPPEDKSRCHFVAIAKKLFAEVTLLDEMLWICKISSTPVVRIYFSQPYQYPVGTCCREPLFIELQHDLSGSFICSSCKKDITKFVYTEDQSKNEEEHFRLKQRESRSRKQNLRCLLTSQKFRGRKLRDNFIQHSKLGEKGSFIMEISMNYSPLPQLPPSSQPISDSLAELKSIIADIFS